jgi:RNA recognition motif-containing protein
LIELFSSCGQVLAVRIVRDRQSGRSKGFAFVEMDHEKACRQAIATYHDQPFGGRPMIVAEANADGRSHR